MTRNISRRSMIGLSATAVAGVALAACAPRGTPVADVATPQADAPKVVEPEVAQPEPAPEIVEIAVARGENPAQPVLADGPARRELTNQTGVRLKMNVVPTDYGPKLSVWLASDTAPDLFVIDSNDTIRDYVPHGVMLSQTALIAQHAPNAQRYLNAQPDLKRRLFDGEVYYVPRMRWNSRGDLNMPCIRTDILEKHSITPPTTFEEILEVVKEMKSAEPNTLGWTQRIFGPSASARLFNNTAFSFGSGFPMYFDHEYEGGKWRYGPLYPEFKEMLDYFTRAYSEGVLDPDYATTTPDMWHEKNSSGRGLFSFENMSFAIRWNGALRAINPEGTWGVVPTPSGLKGIRKYTGKGALGGGWVMGRGNNHPERTIEMIDWMFTPYGLDTTNWGVEGDHYEVVKPRPESIEDFTIDGIDMAMPPDRNKLFPEVWEEYNQRTDPFRTFQSETSTGLLDFSILYDSAIEDQWDPPGEVDGWYATSRSDPGQVPSVAPPPFLPDQVERVKDITTAIEAILVPSYERVILGRETMADYDRAVQQAIASGAEELEELFNEAEAAM
jgi:putative aldouronate transport system substrate-binding protein